MYIFKLLIKNRILKEHLLSCTLLLFAFCGLSQTQKIDSLKNELRVITSPKEKINLYNQLLRSYVNIDTEIAQAYNDTLFTLSKKEGDRKNEMNTVYYNGVISRLNGEYADAKSFTKDYLTYALSIKDSIEITKSYYQLGSINVYLDKTEEAISNFLESLKFLGEKNTAQTSRILNGIGVVYSQTNQYEKSKEYQLRAAKIAEKDKNYNSLAIIYNGIGVTLKNQDSTKKALTYFQKSLDIAEKVNNIRLMGFQYRNIGMIHSIRKEYNKAEPLLEKALDIRKQMNDKTSIGGSLSDLANIYIETNRLDKAEDYLEEAIAIFKENKSISNENTMYYYLSTLEAKRGNAEKALELSDRYYTIRDSLQNVDLQTKINDIDIKYETEKKDKEILAQNLALEKSKSKSQIMTILIVALLLASLLLWFIFQQRQKRIQQQLITIQKEQEVLTLESLIAGEEKERLRIAQELHDGVNGDLSAIKFKLSSLLKMNNEVINEAVSMIDNSCQQVRAISHNLVPPSLQDFKLQEAIANYCENMDNSNKPAISFQHIGATLDFNKKAEVNILRIVQELVTNAIKHAQASEITVQTSMQEGTMQLSVEDNGLGYDVGLENNNGIGLENIKSRVAYLEAEIDVVSNKNGTAYTITFNPDNAS